MRYNIDNADNTEKQITKPYHKPNMNRANKFINLILKDEPILEFTNRFFEKISKMDDEEFENIIDQVFDDGGADLI